MSGSVLLEWFDGGELRKMRLKKSSAAYRTAMEIFAAQLSDPENQSKSENHPNKLQGFLGVFEPFRRKSLSRAYSAQTVVISQI